MQDDLNKVLICSSEVHWSTRAGIFKPLRSPGIDSKESIPPAYVVWRVRYDNPIPTRFLVPIDCFKIPALFLGTRSVLS